MESIKKLTLRANANISAAKEELALRLSDRKCLSITGLHGEQFYLTAYSRLCEKVKNILALYDTIPAHRSVKDTIVLDAYSSATIEGARTTVAQVKRCADAPKTKDDKMVLNTVAGCKYAYERPITGKNIRFLWNKIVADVCENQDKAGTRYRSAMVYVGSDDQIIHTPAMPEQIEGMMEQLFSLQSAPDDVLLNAFACHFYFVYIHPFCDGNGRTARILTVSHLYHSGLKKIKGLALSTAINRQLSGYYRNLQESEQILRDSTQSWLDLSPFVDYMLDIFEQSLIDAAVSRYSLSKSESALLDKMNKRGIGAEITAKKAKDILNCAEGTARNTLASLAKKGYLTLIETSPRHVYRLETHTPEE